jgi:hypothetical protein
MAQAVFEDHPLGEYLKRAPPAHIGLVRLSI